MPTVVAIAPRGGLSRGRHGGQLLRDRGKLLLKSGEKLRGGLVVCVVCQVEVGEFVVEGLFDVVERVVGFDDVGGTVIPGVSGSRGTGDEAKVVRGGEVRFEGVPSFVDGRCAFPFGERNAVETRDLEGHDGHVHHLRHCVWWCGCGDDGSDETVFETVEVGFDGVGWVPWGAEKCIVGVGRP